MVVTLAIELTALAVAVGVALGDLWLLPSPPEDLPRLRTALWRLLGVCVLVLAATAVAELVLRTADMSGLPLPQAFNETDKVLFKTHYGELWSWRAAAVLALAVIWLVQWRRIADRVLSLLILAALLVNVVSLSASGHGGDDGILSAANIAASLHILGASAWGGGVVVYALTLLPPMKSGAEANRSLLASSAQRLSSLAATGLTLILISGIYNAWVLVGSWHGLWTTVYGRMLIGKIILVAAMIALGAVNRYRYVPSLQVLAGQSPPRTSFALPTFLRPRVDAATTLHFLRSLRAEALLLLAILGLAAALSQQMPAAHAAHRMGTGHTATAPQG